MDCNVKGNLALTHLQFLHVALATKVEGKSQSEGKGLHAR